MRNSLLRVALFSLAAVAFVPAPSIANLPVESTAEAPGGPPVENRQKSDQSFLLAQGSEISLVLKQDVSSKRNVKGDLVYFVTGKNVIVDGQAVVPIGTSVVGQIALSEKNGYFGDSGRLEIRLLYIDMGNQTIRVEGSVGERGAPKSGEALAKAGTIMTIGLFKGKNAKIPAGTIVTGRILKDTLVDILQ